MGSLERRARRLEEQAELREQSRRIAAERRLREAYRRMSTEELAAMANTSTATPTGRSGERRTCRLSSGYWLW